MKAHHKSTKQKRSMSIVRKNGRVDLPPDFGTFRLGQRVYFHLHLNEVTLAAMPKRQFNGRMLSCRIRRGIRSLALYGPRATSPQARR